MAAILQVDLLDEAALATRFGVEATIDFRRRGREWMVFTAGALNRGRNDVRA